MDSYMAEDPLRWRRQSVYASGDDYVFASETIRGKQPYRSGINITPAHETDHVTMGISLIMSTRGVGLLPAYAQNFLPASVTSRPLKGDMPTVDLVLGYRKSNQSPILKLLLSRVDELVARASK